MLNSEKLEQIQKLLYEFQHAKGNLKRFSRQPDAMIEFRFLEASSSDTSRIEVDLSIELPKELLLSHFKCLIASLKNELTELGFDCEE